jgi:hypothetical protein
MMSASENSVGDFFTDRYFSRELSMLDEGKVKQNHNRMMLSDSFMMFEKRI